MRLHLSNSEPSLNGFSQSNKTNSVKEIVQGNGFPAARATLYSGNAIHNPGQSKSAREFLTSENARLSEANLTLKKFLAENEEIDRLKDQYQRLKKENQDLSNRLSQTNHGKRVNEASTQSSWAEFFNK